MGERDDGAAVVGLVVLVLGVVVAIAVPKPVWITFAIILVAAGSVVVGTLVRKDFTQRRELRVAAERAISEERAQLIKARRRDRLGSENLERLEAAHEAADRVAASEAAAEGWLGEVDFADDLRTIADHFEKSTALRKTATDLTSLADPGPDDRRIVGDARIAAERLEYAANRLADLMIRCADEADLIDDSLRRQRESAENERRRAELHGDLSAMLYGVESTPAEDAAEYDAERVLARVTAYREIVKEIARVRDTEAGR